MASTNRVAHVEKTVSGRRIGFATLNISSYTTNGEPLSALLAALGIENPECVMASAPGGRGFELVGSLGAWLLKGYTTGTGTEIAGAVNVGTLSIIIEGA
jgi:hypothetical protein